ncbi:MAG TPA: helix-turn-helix transcriptional regulator [Vicinamibacterales bacterium]|nr:helix-turn-helix transcriptional regulator [Vicinamibacterales bacterium]
MNSTFGARLKAQREQQQISLSTISERTKIKQSLLEALERDDVRHWPQGLFGRSYVRTYAEAIGLDPDATLREFMEFHPVEPQVPLTELREKTAERSNRWPPTRLQFLIDSAIDAFHTRRAEQSQKAGPDLSPPAGSPRLEQPDPAVVRPADTQSADQSAASIDFLVLAKLCTKLACAEDAPELTSVLEDAAGVLGGVGLILWIPDTMGVFLTTAFAYGYPAEMIAQLPSVPAEATNAIAEAFRTRTTCVVKGTAADNGAIVAPLLTPSGCSGVISLEMRGGEEQRDEVRAAVMILAAQVSTLMGFSVLAHTRSA